MLRKLIRTGKGGGCWPQPKKYADWDKSTFWTVSPSHTSQLLSLRFFCLLSFLSVLSEPSESPISWAWSSQETCQIKHNSQLWCCAFFFSVNAMLVKFLVNSAWWTVHVSLKWLLFSLIFPTLYHPKTLSHVFTGHDPKECGMAFHSRHI